MANIRWQLTGKTALITGASQGIGYACAREFAELGADLILVARDEDRLSVITRELEDEFDVSVQYVSADLSDGEGRESAGATQVRRSRLQGSFSTREERCGNQEQVTT